MTAKPRIPADASENSVVFNLAELGRLEESRIAEETETRVRAELAREQAAQRAREREQAERERLREQRALEDQLARFDHDLARVREQESQLLHAQAGLARELGTMRSQQLALGERLVVEPSRATTSAPTWLAAAALALALVSTGIAAFLGSQQAALLREVGVAAASVRQLDARLAGQERATAALRAELTALPTPDLATAAVPTPTSEGPVARPGTGRPHVRHPPAPTGSLTELDRCPDHDPLCGGL